MFYARPSLNYQSRPERAVGSEEQSGGRRPDANGRVVEMTNAEGAPVRSALGFTTTRSSQQPTQLTLHGASSPSMRTEAR